MAVTIKARPPKARISRAARIDQICGKYRHVQTSAARFASQKQREIKREANRR
jgi:hypothetical protein